MLSVRYQRTHDVALLADSFDSSKHLIKSKLLENIDDDNLRLLINQEDISGFITPTIFRRPSIRLDITFVTFSQDPLPLAKLDLPAFNYT